MKRKSMKPYSCFHIYGDIKHLFHAANPIYIKDRASNYKSIVNSFKPWETKGIKEEFIVTYSCRTALDLFF